MSRGFIGAGWGVGVGLGALVVASSGACGSRTGLYDELAPSPPVVEAGPVGIKPRCAPGGPGLSDCGMARESCCTSLAVPGGTYDRSYMNLGAGPEAAGDPATISAFQLDKYEVTVGRFRVFKAAWDAGYRPAPGDGKHTHLNGGQGLVDVSSGRPAGFEPGWSPASVSGVDPTDDNLLLCNETSSWTATVGDNERQPISCISFQEAQAFCIWDGGFLLSEAEWELAAAGGDEEREYPWGQTDPGDQIAYAIYDDDYPVGAKGAAVTASAPVGTANLGAGKWGHLDLAGNVAEWVLDTYADYVSPCVDCASLSTRLYVPNQTRGGFFSDAAQNLGPAVRFTTGPGRTASVAGIRCGRAP